MFRASAITIRIIKIIINVKNRLPVIFVSPSIMFPINPPSL